MIKCKAFLQQIFDTTQRYEYVGLLIYTTGRKFTYFPTWMLGRSIE